MVEVGGSAERHEGLVGLYALVVLYEHLSDIVPLLGSEADGRVFERDADGFAHDIGVFDPIAQPGQQGEAYERHHSAPAQEPGGWGTQDFLHIFTAFFEIIVLVHEVCVYAPSSIWLRTSWK